MTFALPHALAEALLPRYQLGDPIAEGGQAIVFRATDTVVGRQVALKVLPLAATSAVGRERFLREIKLLAGLNHPGVIPIFDAGEAPGVLWYAMPLLRGDTLAGRIAQGRVSSDLVRRWGSEIAEALSVAHAHGIVHRDVKPANIHLVEEHALLADFGVAALDGDETLTSPGETPGSRRYMAPEQWRGSADARTDIYGLGVSLIEAASGTPWDPGAPRWSVLPRDLRGPLRRAVAEAPENRWPTAKAFQASLARRSAHLGRWRVVAISVIVIATGWNVFDHTPVLEHDTDIEFLGFAGSALETQLARATVTRLEWFPPILTAPWQGEGAAIAARYRVEGSIERAPSGYVAMIAIRDSAGIIQELLRVPGDSTDMPGWASAVADAVIQAVAPTRSVEFREYAGGARIGAALRRFYEGQSAFERQEWRQAEEAFRDAVALDSGFQQARWSMLLTRKWARLPYETELRALAAGADLPPPLGALVAAQLEVDLARRMVQLDSLALAWPRVAEVQLVRANELFHRGALTGRPLTEALDALESAARRFPSLDRPVVWDHVAWGAIRLGDASRAREALARQSSTAGESDPWSALLRYAVESRFRPVVGRILEVALKFGGSASRERLRDAVRLGITFDLPESELRLATWLTQPDAPARVQASDWSARALAHLMMGQPRAALAAMDSAAALVPGDAEQTRQRWEWRLMLPMFGVPVDATEQARARDALGALAARADWGAPGMPARESTRDSDIVVRDASDSVAAARGAFLRAMHYWREGEGRLADGDTTGALVSWQWTENVDLRGWPNGAPQEGELDAALSPVARWHRARLLMAQGQEAAGCALLGQVERLWNYAEPEFANSFPSSWTSRCPR